MQTNFPTQAQMNSFLHGLHGFVAVLPKLALIAVAATVGVMLLWGLFMFVLRLLEYRRLLGRNLVFLELTPSAYSEKTPHANQQFFVGLQGLETMLSQMDRLLLRSIVFSAEVVATRALGIRFIFCIPTALQESFERAVASFGSDVEVRETSDYLAPVYRSRARLSEFRLRSRYYPLQSHGSYEESDPMGQLLSALGNLKDDDVIALQLILKPARVRHAERISNRILHHHEHMDSVGKRRPWFSGEKLAYGINTAMFGMTDTIGGMYQGTSSHITRTQQGMMDHYMQVDAGIRPARAMGRIETALAEQVSGKLNQPLFYANIRALAVSRTAAEKVHGIARAFNVYRTQYQAVVKRRESPFTLRYRQYLMFHRLPSILETASILSASEVASVYHFPHNGSAAGSEVVKSLSKTLPAPVTVRKKADGGEFSVVLGRNEHQGTRVDIGLTAEERERHVFIVGGTGNGKTTMLFYSILQDIRAGNGVAVVDPHGDLAERILRYIPEKRVIDVIYMNPDDLAYPVGMNLLELPEGLSGDELLREKDLVTEATVSVLRKIFSDDDTGGHRIEYVLRNSIQTVLTLENPTLFTIYELLNDAVFRRKVVKGLTDKNLINFWDNELGKAGEFQRVKMAAGITAKIGRFLFSASAKRILEQPRSTIDFDDVLASKKILICNFSKGLLGEDTSALFGTTVLAKLQTATLRRARMPGVERTPFYLNVDEFQNFATISFTQMLSEARKYKLFLTMAEQSTTQQEHQRLVHIILANVGTVVCFRSGSPIDEELVLSLFQPYLEQGQIANLPSYSFYMRIAAVKPHEPMSGVTVVVDDVGSKDIAQRVIESSRERYAKQYKDVDVRQDQDEVRKVKKVRKSKKQDAIREPV